MSEFPDLPGSHEIGNPDNAFDASESRVGRAIAEAVYELVANEQSAHILPGMGVHFGAGENRIAVAVAQALKEKGLVLAKAGVDIPRYAERITLDSNKVFYVDANTTLTAGDGLSLASPIKSLYQALSMIRHKFDLNGYTVQIRLAPGTYGATALQNLMLNGKLEIIGTSTSHTRIESISMENVVNDVYLKGVTLVGTSYFENCNTVTLDTTAFKSLRTVQSRLKLSGSQVICCNSDYPLDIRDGSLVRAIDVKFKLDEELTEFAAFNRVVNQSGVIYDNCIFLGEKQINGYPCWLKNSSFIKTGTNELDFLPGSLTPVIEPGCSYDQIIGSDGKLHDIELWVSDIRRQVRSLNAIEKTANIPPDLKERIETLQADIEECKKKIKNTKVDLSQSVTTFNKRKGAVVPQAGDYYADDIWYSPTYGVSVKEMLASIDRDVVYLKDKAKIFSFNKRVGDIEPQRGDYTSEIVTHNGSPLRMSLEQLHQSIRELEKFRVTSFHDRTGKIMPRTGDYTADMIPVENEDFQSLSGETVQETLYDIDQEYKMLYSRVNSLFNEISELQDKMVTCSSQVTECLRAKSRDSERLSTLEEKIDSLLQIIGMHEDDRLLRLEEDTTFVVKKDSNNDTLQKAIDYLYREVNLSGHEATLNCLVDMTSIPTHIQGDPIGTGSLIIESTQPIGDIQLEGCHKIIFSNCNFAGAVKVSDHSNVVFENCFFGSHTYNQLVVNNHSTVKLRGVTRCLPSSENTLMFGVAEHDSMISVENGSKLVVLDAEEGTSYFRFFSASFRSTIDVRAASIVSEREQVINLYSLSILMGQQSLPPNISVVSEETQHCVVLP